MAVLRYVMEHQPTTARQVADGLADNRGIARTTTHTLLERLRKKGYLARTEETGSIQYSLAVDAAEIQQALVDDFVRTTLGGSLSPFVAFFTDRANLSDAEAAELRRLLERAEQGDGK